MNRPHEHGVEAGAVASRLRNSARTLFLNQGYSATTTKQIAAHAMVSERTLFNIYTGKADLLREATIEVITQGSGRLNSTVRRDFQRAMNARLPARQIHLFAAAVSALHEEVAPLAAVCRQASFVDTAAAEFWKWGTAQSRRDCDEFVRSLKVDPIRESALKITVDATAVLTSHETYWQLTVDYSWSRNTYRRWLRHELSATLLPPSL